MSTAGHSRGLWEENSRKETELGVSSSGSGEVGALKRGQLRPDLGETSRKVGVEEPGDLHYKLVQGTSGSV